MCVCMQGWYKWSGCMVRTTLLVAVGIYITANTITEANINVYGGPLCAIKQSRQIV